jgi:hypothetical protein
VLGLAGGRTLAGNRIVVGTDPVEHGATLTSVRGEIIRDGISYAGQQPNRTGMYFDSTCAADYYGQSAQTLAILTSLSAGVGAWTIHTGTGGPGSTVPCGGSVSLIASVLPAFATLTTASLQGWSCSVHEAFPIFPSDWSALAVATDAVSLTPTCGTDPNTHLNACGEPYILVAGSSIVVVSGSISVTPPDATNPTGTNHTVTAHVTSGGSPLVGQVVTFTVTGQNAGAVGTCVLAGCVTDSNGDVSFTYHDTKGAGDDTIKASFTDATGSLQSATAQKHWVGVTPTDAPCTAFAGMDISTGTHGIVNDGSNVDPIWTVAPGGSAGYSGQAYGTATLSGWFPPAGANWAWVDINPGGTSSSDPAGDYFYQTSFFVPANAPVVSLNMYYAADNSVQFTLKGPVPGANLPVILPAAFTTLNPAFTSPNGHYASYAGSLSSGTYTLRATVHNNELWTGFFVHGTVSCGNGFPVGGLVALSVSDSGSPVPWTPLAAVAAGVTAVLAAGLWYARRRWLR